MKRKILSTIALSLLSIFLGFGVGSNYVRECSAEETKIEYCDIGPAIYNDKQTGTPIDKFDGNSYSIALRGGKLLIYPNKDYYKDSPRGGVISSNELADTNLNDIRFYTDKNNFKTVSEYAISPATFHYTIWSDAGLHIALDLNSTSFRIKDIYQITFNEGFTFPYASSDHSTKLVLKQSLIFRNNGYHGSDVDDTFYSSSWAKNVNEIVNEEDDGYQTIPIAAFAREQINYRAHIRGNINEVKEETTSEDNGTARLFIFFGDYDYNEDIYNQSNVDINAERFDVSEENPNSYLHTLYERVILIGPDKVERTLKEVSNPEEKGLPIYNCWGEKCCITFNLGNEYGTKTGTSYCADQIASVKVLRGCEFPKFSYTNGSDNVETRYSQIDDISISFISRVALWATSADYSFNAADIQVSNFAAREVDVHDNDIDVTGTVIDIELSECNYSGLTNREIFTIGEVCTRYIYVNGRSLYYAYGNNNVRFFANLDGKENIFSVLVPEELNNIKEIIVQKGCSVPAVVSTTESMDIYGNSVSYYVVNSQSYSGSGSNFVKNDKIYWTLWFDGQNPKRVSNASTFDLDTVEDGISNETQRFIRWVDATGEEAKGYSRITSGREYFGEYVYIHLVKVLGLDKYFEFRVDNYTRLSEVDSFKDYAYPVKEGYFFMGWKTSTGEYYNITNRVTGDLVIEATWMKDESYVSSSKGCKGSAITSSVAAIILSLSAVVIFISRKNKKD